MIAFHANHGGARGHIGYYMMSDLFVICVYAASNDSQVVGLVLNEGYAVTDDSLATDFDFGDALNISRKEMTRWNRIMRALGLL